MKKIFALFLINIFAIPVIAACPLDTDKPCTADTTDNIRQSVRTETEDPLQKQNINITKNDTDLQNYDSDCQFGVCIPQKMETEIKP